MSQNPFFSIIIPFFNNKNTIQRALDSIVNQSYSDWELVLVNDGSQDGSFGLISKYLTNSSIKYFSQKNAGVTKSRNRGAELSTGDWLIFLDADDELEHNALESFKKTIDSVGNEVKLVRAGFRKFSSGVIKDFIPSSNVAQSFLSGSFAISKESFFQLQGYDINLKFSENSELYHRFLLSGEFESFTGSVALVYHESTGGGSKNLQNMIDSLTFILEKHAETLTPHVKHLYHQIIGVNWIRFRNFSKARHHLYQAVKYKPSKLSSWGRLFLACFPIVARRLYSETVNHG